MNTIKILRYPYRALILFLSLMILMLSSVLLVYADPEEKEPAPGAWIEVVCPIVPEDFEGSVSIVVSDVETDESYTIDCLKANGFVGRKKLPYGKYFVDRIYTSDTFYYEGFTDLFSFELTEKMTAAKKIEIEVIKNNVPDDVFTMTPGSQSDTESVLGIPSEEVKDTENGEDTKATEMSASENKADTDQGSDTSIGNEEAQESDVSSDDSLTTKKVLQDIGISLLVTVVFVAVVALIVFFVRSRYFEEE